MSAFKILTVAAIALAVGAYVGRDGWIGILCFLGCVWVVLLMIRYGLEHLGTPEAYE